MSLVENLVFNRPAVYRLKCFVIETIIWKWVLCGVFKLEQKTLPALLSASDGRRVLMVACGPGIVSTGPSIENAAEVVACDISYAFIKTYRTIHPDRQVYGGNVICLPHRDNEFDVVVMYSTLHHVNAAAADILSELARISNNKIVVLEGVVPVRGLLRHALLLWYKLVDGGHRYYTREELEETFSTLGLGIEKTEFYSPINHMMLSVLRVEQKKTTEPNTSSADNEFSLVPGDQQSSV